MAGDPSFVAGAIIAFIAALFSNFGTNLMKSCHLDIQRAPPDHRRPYYTYRKWWCAFALTVGGALGDFVALGLASQPLVASLGGGTTLVANVYIANRMNGEKIMRSDLIGVALVVLGAVIFAIMGASNTTATVTLEIMEARFQRPGFIVYATVQTCVILALLSSVATSAVYRWRDGLTQLLLKPFSLRLKLLEQRMDLELEYLRREVAALREEVASTNQIARRLTHGGTEEDKVSEALRRRASSAVRAVRRPLKELRKLEDDAKHNWKDAYVYAATSGAIGAVSVLFAGCSSKSIIEAFNNPDSQPFTRPLPYVFIVGMVVCIVLQQDFLNKALMRGDTMTIFPVFQVGS
jgi:magnesium transporter